MVEVRDSANNLLVTYRYDGLNRRVRETVSGTTTDFYYSSGWQVLEEDVSGTAKVSYVWSPVYVDALIARDRDADGNSGNGLEERLYVMQDANFNVVGLLNTSGTAQERYLYDPYGSVTYLTGTWGSRSSSSYNWIVNFQGLRVDAVANGINDRNRELTPTLGREGRLDPLGFGGGDINLYRALRNAPNVFVDPLGRSSVGPVLTGGPYPLPSPLEFLDALVEPVRVAGDLIRAAEWEAGVYPGDPSEVPDWHSNTAKRADAALQSGGNWGDLITIGAHEWSKSALAYCSFWNGRVGRFGGGKGPAPTGPTGPSAPTPTRPSLPPTELPPTVPHEPAPARPGVPWGPQDPGFIPPGTRFGGGPIWGDMRDIINAMNRRDGVPELPPLPPNPPPGFYFWNGNWYRFGEGPHPNGPPPQ